MTEIEARILKNQFEIIWALNYLLKGANRDLVGRGGELDRLCDDLRHAANDTLGLIRIGEKRAKALSDLAENDACLLNQQDSKT